MKLPNYLDKQKLLYINPPDKGILKKYGDLLFENDRIDDAVDFYQKGEYIEGLEKILNIAIEEGDFFLCERVLKAINKDLNEEEWNKIGLNALKLGKYKFAQLSFQRAHNDVLLKKVKVAIEEEFELQKV
jgi:tetratricopeptide (TPR) repeat protein